MRFQTNTALWPIVFTSKSVSGTELQYGNIEWNALGILHGLEKFHHYCFTKEVYIITYHKPLVVMVNKDVTTLSQWQQYIMLCIHQYGMHMLYKPGPDLCIVNWLSWHSHTENGSRKEWVWQNHMHNKTVLDVLVCTLIENIWAAMSEDAELQILQAHIIKEWP